MPEDMRSDHYKLKKKSLAKSTDKSECLACRDCAGSLTYFTFIQEKLCFSSPYELNEDLRF